MSSGWISCDCIFNSFAFVKKPYGNGIFLILCVSYNQYVVAYPTLPSSHYLRFHVLNSSCVVTVLGPWRSALQEFWDLSGNVAIGSDSMFGMVFLVGFEPPTHVFSSSHYAASDRVWMEYIHSELCHATITSTHAVPP